ncbi:MAG: 16S rRNA (guanine(527)-N(7))-methyltransferase RsmG [Wenzhouxiangellaceae bacterium]|nr:16S rRNA (guanine(527)-N(7))-methyltransferase RsmG [Wenzhouxiangellaceae bacterium]MBS3824284.1 16S rRNA (guanine(527)-N(7))-methyltransferase RsmG [Wenzhouxiangellaceae bacterium]
MSERNRTDSTLPRKAMARRLVAGLENLGQTLSGEQVETLLDYLAELVRWNKAYNLTAVTDPMEMVERHMMDSLSIRPFIEGRRILDSGTGAGLPGVVLAVAEPGRQFVLVDSNGKKVRFLRHIKRTLGLDNIEPIHARLESLTLDPPPDQIVARALAPLARLVEWHRPWLEQGARLLAMKGQLEPAEIDELSGDYSVEKHALEWAGMHGERCVAVVARRKA